MSILSTRGLVKAFRKRRVVDGGGEAARDPASPPMTAAISFRLASATAPIR